MKKRVELVLIEKGKKATLYSFRLDDDAMTEYEKFAENPVLSSKEDFERVNNKLNDMIEKYGFLNTFFKNAGTPTDSVCELKGENWEGIRLFLCRFGESLAIAGNGGIKTTQTYQDDPVLYSHVKILQQVDFAYDKALKDGTIYLNEAITLNGDLKFEIEL